jgi:hypothetical protein
MKNLKLILIGIISMITFNVSGQEDLTQEDIVLYEFFDSVFTEMKKDHLERPSYKVGDDNRSLRGVFKGFFKDELSIQLFLSSDQGVNILWVDGFTFNMEKENVKVPVTEWAKSIDPSLYPSDKYDIKYLTYNNIEEIEIYDKEGNNIRTIHIFWDDSYNNQTNSNIRLIRDSLFNE